MPDAADNLVLSLLREMRGSIQETRADIKELRETVVDLGEKMESWQGTIATAAGFAVHANVRGSSFEKELEALKKRVEKLEESR